MDQARSVPRNRDDRQPSIYRVGEVVNLTIRDAMIVEIDQDVLTVETGDGQQVAIIPGANVVIQHIHPAGGPIQPGDIWSDRHARRWFAQGRTDGSIWMVTQDGRDACGADGLARYYSPLTREYRPGAAPTAPAVVNEPAPAESDDWYTSCQAEQFAGQHTYTGQREVGPDYEVCCRPIDHPIHQLDEDVEGGDDRG